jgi:hypothetical protein
MPLGGLLEAIMASRFEGQLKLRDERPVNARKAREHRKSEKTLVLQGFEKAWRAFASFGLPSPFGRR